MQLLGERVTEVLKRQGHPMGECQTEFDPVYFFSYKFLSLYQAKEVINIYFQVWRSKPRNKNTPSKRTKLYTGILYASKGKNRKAFDSFKNLGDRGSFKILKDNRAYKSLQLWHKDTFNNYPPPTEDKDAALPEKVAKKLMEAYDLYHADLEKIIRGDPQLNTAQNNIEVAADSPDNGRLMISPHPLNQILYGPPGTGKTYQTRALAVAICHNKSTEEIESLTREEVNDFYRDLENKGQIVFTTFHQSLAYEDFIEGIKPNNVEGRISYSVREGIFKAIASQAKQREKGNSFEIEYNKVLDKVRNSDGVTLKLQSRRGEFLLTVDEEDNLKIKSTNKVHGWVKHHKLYEYITNNNPSFIRRDIYNSVVADYFKSEMGTINEGEADPFVLIIDEINRGNVSAIFGELITLIEDGKRAGQDEEIRVTLPYSQETFSLPANLHIIGTMNTADRSVEALDTALRRRFVFEEMMPRPELLDRLGDSIGLDLNLLLTTINQRLTYLKDKNHTLGHAFFINQTSALGIIAVIAQKVLPLLEEFFYGETVKIGMVLSSKFLYGATDAPAARMIFNLDGKGLADELNLNLEDPLPRRSLTGPELLASVNNEEDAMEYLKSILPIRVPGA